MEATLPEGLEPHTVTVFGEPESWILDPPTGLPKACVGEPRSQHPTVESSGCRMEQTAGLGNSAGVKIQLIQLPG